MSRPFGAPYVHTHTVETQVPPKGRGDRRKPPEVTHRSKIFESTSLRAFSWLRTTCRLRCYRNRCHWIRPCPYYLSFNPSPCLLPETACPTAASPWQHGRWSECPACPYASQSNRKSWLPPDRVSIRPGVPGTGYGRRDHGSDNYGNSGWRRCTRGRGRTGQAGQSVVVHGHRRSRCTFYLLPRRDDRYQYLVLNTARQCCNKICSLSLLGRGLGRRELIEGVRGAVHTRITESLPMIVAIPISTVVSPLQGSVSVSFRTQGVALG